MWNEYFPLLIVGAIIGTFSIIFILAYALMKNKKETGSYGFTDQLPQKSSLQKSTIDYIKNGGTLGEGIGVIIK